MWPFKPRTPATPPILDSSAWREIDGTVRNPAKIMECGRCLMRWDTRYQQPACTCTLPRRIHPPAPPRNPIPQPDPERRSRPRFGRLSNQVPPYPLPTRAGPTTPCELEAEAASRLVAAEAYRLNTARDVAVATDTYWQEDVTTCPRGAKVQLLGAGGVAVYGSYHGDPFWVGWAPVPRRRPL